MDIFLAARAGAQHERKNIFCAPARPHPAPTGLPWGARPAAHPRVPRPAPTRPDPPGPNWPKPRTAPATSRRACRLVGRGPTGGRADFMCTRHPRAPPEPTTQEDEEEEHADPSYVPSHHVHNRSLSCCVQCDSRSFTANNMSL